MGKILTYLGIDEAGQTRDILDAERLLEGMQSLYANSPEGKKKDSFAVPLAEMTKTFIEQVKGIKPKEKPKEEQVSSGNAAKGLAQLLASMQEFILKELEVTPSIVYNNEDFQKKYILAMQKVIMGFFNPQAPPSIKEIAEFVKSLGGEDNQNGVQQLTKELNLLARELEENGSEFNNDLVDNFLALYNVLGKKLKDDYIDYYNLTKKDLKKVYLNPALFESLMDVSEKPENGTDSGTSTTLPPFIKPISYDKPSKPPKPLKPSKPSKPKFKVGDRYSLLLGNIESNLTIVEVDVDNVKVEFADGLTHTFEINKAEAYVKSRVWKKIEPEFKVGDVYFSETFRQKLTITNVKDDKINVTYEDDTEESYTPTYCRLSVSRKDWVKVVDEEMPEQDQAYKVGDNFITADNQDLTFKIDFIQPDSIGVVYFDGLTAIINPEDFKKGLKSGYYKPYKEPEEENDLYFKEGDEFIEKKTKNKYIIGKVNKNLDVVKIKIASRDNDGYSEYTIPYVQGLIKKGYWVKKDAKPSRPSKPTSKPTTPTTLSDKDKQIKHILDINIEDIDF